LRCLLARLLGGRLRPFRLRLCRNGGDLTFLRRHRKRHRLQRKEHNEGSKNGAHRTVLNTSSRPRKRPHSHPGCSGIYGRKIIDRR
jgi:hypothetical protein